MVFIHIDENGLKEILADEIMSKIEIGDSLIEYQHVFIKGDLNISELSVPKDQNGKLLVLPLICIKNSVIKGFLNFNSCALKEAFILEETTIKGAAYFYNTDFRGDAYFIGSIFEGNVQFWDSTFRYADFSEAKFMKRVDFSGSKFSGENLSFESTVFASPLSQEDACRRAKIVLEANGDREKLDLIFIERWKVNGNESPGISATQNGFLSNLYSDMVYTPFALWLAGLDSSVFSTLFTFFGME